MRVEEGQRHALPHAPVEAPMAQSIPAKETTAAVDDGAMDDAQQVLEESPARFELYSYFTPT